MPQGKVTTVPDDGLTTRQRRRQAVLAVNTGHGKGKSTAAFGMALRVLGASPEGGSVTWHKMGEGWSWIQRAGTERDHAAEAAEGWQQIKRDLAAETYKFYVLDEFTYAMKWGWVDVDDVVATLAERPGTQHVVITGRDAAPELLEAADLVTEMTKVKHPMDAGRKGQQGIEW